MIPRHYFFLPGLLLVLFSASILLFYSGPGAYADRSFRELWNLGHVLYFGLLIILVSKILNHYQVSGRWIWIFSILLTLIWGIAIEMIQQGSDRNADIMDVIRNLCGALLALVFIPGSIQVFHRRFQKIIRYVVVCFLLLVLIPLMVSVADEVVAANQFPVLSNFETPFELDRWNGSADFKIVDSVEGSGRSALQISLSTQDIYTGVGMQYLESDWRDYEFLNIDIFYPQIDPLQLTLKVFDSQHRSVEPTYLYSDRFNRPYQIQNGWNRIRVSLQEISSAPQKREMNLSEIAGLQLFAVRLKQPETIYLDRIYLSD